MICQHRCARRRRRTAGRDILVHLFYHMRIHPCTHECLQADCLAPKARGAMGLKLSRAAPVEERWLRPTGLYPDADVDLKKLRRLILDRKLAPCYEGLDEEPSSLEVRPRPQLTSCL